MCNKCNGNCNSCECTCNSPCTTPDCSCKVFISTDCVTLSEDLTCSNILKGITETEALKQLDTYICQRFTSVENFLQITNVGGGSEIYKGISVLGKKELRTLIDSSLINIVEGTDEITISVDEAMLNTFIEANQKTYTVANVGVGAKVYKDSIVAGDSTTFNLKKIKSTDSSVTIIEGTDDIDIKVPVVIPPDGSETKVNQGTNITITGNGTTPTPYIINGLLPPLEKLTEGAKTGIAIRSRDPLNYGSIGTNAVDLSISTSPSSTLGATGTSSFASGDRTTASAPYSTATGADTIASQSFSNASGYQSVASGFSAHAEGDDTIASGHGGAHSEGGNTTASGDSSHAQNLDTTASGVNSHAEGELTTSSGRTSHAEGYQSRSIGNYSHAGGNNNDANAYCETSIGMFGTAPAGNPTTFIATDRLFSVGNGLNAGALSDAVAVFKNGLATLPSVTNALITAASGKAIVTKEYLATQIPILPSPPDGSETKVTAGTGISVTGTGTMGTPYVINSTAATGVQSLIQYLPIWTSNQQHSLSPALSGKTIISAIPFLECTSAIQNISVGDIITAPTPESNDSGGHPDQGIGIQFNNSAPTTIRVLVGELISAMVGYTATGATNGTFTVSPSNFKIRVVILYI